MCDRDSDPSQHDRVRGNRTALKEAARHKPEPDGPHWWTVNHSDTSVWRAGCRHCERVVAYVARTDSWRHIRS